MQILVIYKNQSGYHAEIFSKTSEAIDFLSEQLLKSDNKDGMIVTLEQIYNQKSWNISQSLGELTRIYGV